MPMTPPLPITMARPLAVVESAKQDVLLAPDLVEGAEAADRPVSDPAAAAIEDQRERAQQEFKRIWNLCTLTH